ncbi:MAG: hypothetical protein IT454_00690 [Planctomycetes bacterium]|nr:hypothetical protein [Planctomycetota bacterium]
MRTLRVVLPFLACAASCSALQYPNDGPPLATPTDASAPESRLYARDGSVVADGERAASNSGPQRELAPSEGGRMYILELYQKAIDERDALALESRTLQGDVEALKQALAARDATVAEQLAKLEQLSGENRRLVEENVELAARLTTAQIRRLQVEKILLEARVAELAAAAAAAAAAQNANATPDAAPTTNGKP